MSKIQNLIDAMESIAPTRFAEPWDNVGLLAGDPAQPLAKILLTIDYTPAVAAEGKRLGCDAVIAYHPPIFQGLKRIPADSVLHDAVRRGVAIYSPHTAWDVADGGTNDVLANLLGLTDLRPLKPAEGLSPHYRLVVFVPDYALDTVADALFRAGAGALGNYSKCSFRSPGVGTFFGESGAQPAVGKPGRLELVDEIRLETILPLANVDRVIAALRLAHPYEEPAFDLVQLAATPEGKGIGRIGTTNLTHDQLAARLKRGLNLKHLLRAGPTKGPIKTVAICAGAGGELLDLALKNRADAYITGELRHHDALRAAAAGLTTLSTLHSNSERASLPALAALLKPKLKGVKFAISKADRDPFAVV